MLVSNSFPILGSVASLPFVTVCGVESSLSTAIVSPTFTVSESGSYDGFPYADAPCGIFRVAAAVVAEGVPAPGVVAVEVFEVIVVGSLSWHCQRHRLHWHFHFQVLNR